MIAWISASPSPAATPGSSPCLPALAPMSYAGVPHRGQQRDDRGRGVEADGVADAGVLGRVGRQHERDPPLPRRDVPQPGVLHGDARDPRGALRVGDVAGQAVGAGLLERERHGDQAAVELGDRDLGGGVQRGQPLVAARPLGARTRSGTGPAGSGRPGRPARPRPSPRRRRRRRPMAGTSAAGREHGHDDRVRGAQRVDQRGLGGPQRRAEHRQRPAAGRLTASASACTKPVFPAT